MGECLDLGDFMCEIEDVVDRIVNIYRENEYAADALIRRFLNWRAQQSDVPTRAAPLLMGVAIEFCPGNTWTALLSCDEVPLALALFRVWEVNGE